MSRLPKQLRKANAKLGDKTPVGFTPVQPRLDAEVSGIERGVKNMTPDSVGSVAAEEAGIAKGLSAMGGAAGSNAGPANFRERPEGFTPPSPKRVMTKHGPASLNQGTYTLLSAAEDAKQFPTEILTPPTATFPDATQGGGGVLGNILSKFFPTREGEASGQNPLDAKVQEMARATNPEADKQDLLSQLQAKQAQELSEQGQVMQRDLPRGMTQKNFDHLELIAGMREGNSFFKDKGPSARVAAMKEQAHKNQKIRRDELKGQIDEELDRQESEASNDVEVSKVSARRFEAEMTYAASALNSQAEILKASYTDKNQARLHEQTMSKYNKEMLTLKNQHSVIVKKMDALAKIENTKEANAEAERKRQNELQKGKAEIDMMFKWMEQRTKSYQVKIALISNVREADLRDYSLSQEPLLSSMVMEAFKDPESIASLPDSQKAIVNWLMQEDAVTSELGGINMFSDEAKNLSKEQLRLVQDAVGTGVLLALTSAEGQKRMRVRMGGNATPPNADPTKDNPLVTEADKTDKTPAPLNNTDSDKVFFNADGTKRARDSVLMNELDPDVHWRGMTWKQQTELFTKRKTAGTRQKVAAWWALYDKYKSTART